MPTDEEIYAVLTVWANRRYNENAATTSAIRQIRTLFAQPERMSVRLEILRDLAVAAVGRNDASSYKVGDLLRIADELIAAAKEPRND